MIFATSHSNRPEPQLRVAMYRAFTEPTPQVWEQDDTTTRLWWGPTVRVRRGDIVHWFATPEAVLVERVESAP